jgi:WD40 repeat protein/serine/threonine protein kinase
MNERSIFLAALEKEGPAERQAFLDERCGTDVALRERVGKLLQAHGAVGGILDRPAEDPGIEPGCVGSASTQDATPLAEVPGTFIGPYKLLQHLGEGGMGAVFLAEQKEPVQRRVALKVIKAGMDSTHVLGRFEAERQALALMDHPNIARVLDAGATDTGRPYFVMELVKGIPIAKYCDQEYLTPRQRLELFIPVCQAVQHAHQKGIIHRDLKPSNVLIALYDGKPVPKVIDFGVAKATAQKLTERTMFTQVGQIVGTLEYMSPEQAELNQLDVDTRTDIYSLGVLLYELLTGSPPFTAQQLRSAAFTDMLRMIREVEPTKPSTKISGSKELPSIAAKRKVEPKRLAKLVRGDIDWIVMKCLEKERGRRYETANGLARDLELYLADEPVSAGPPGAGYRLRKFVRRNRGPVLAAALLLLALLGGIAGTTWGLVVADRALDDEAKQRVAAEQALDDKEKARADAVTNAKEADREKKEAENARDLYRHTLYNADLNLIQNAWEANNIGRVHELLLRQRPKEGTKGLRGFEWHYWDRLSHQELLTAELGSRNMVAVVFSPDGTRFAAVVRTPLPDKPGSFKTEGRVWDIADGKQLLTLEGAYGLIADLTYLRGGKRLVARTDQGAKVWDAATGKALVTLQSPGPVSQVVAGIDAEHVAGVVKTTIQGKEQEAVQVWSVSTGAALATCPVVGGAGKVSVAGKVTFSPDVKWIAAIVKPERGEQNAVVKVWAAATGAEVATCPVSSGAADAVLFNAVQPKVIFSPDGKRVAATVILFDPEAMKAVTGKNPVGPAPQALQDWQQLINSAAGGIRLWDAATGKEFLTLKGLPFGDVGMAFNPDGKHLAAVDGATGNVKVWDAETGKERLSIISRLTRGDTVSTANPRGITPAAGLFDLSVVYSADGKRFAVSGVGPAVKVWDTEKGELRLNFKGHTGITTRVDFSPDGKRVYSAATDGTMKVWNATASGERTGFGGRLILSPDGRRLADQYVIAVEAGKKTATITQGVRVWDTTEWKGKELCTLKVVSAGSTALAFSHDGKRLAAATQRKLTSNERGMQIEGGVQVWDTDTGKELVAFDAPVGLLPNAALSPDGRRLAICADQKVWVWDAETGKGLWSLSAMVLPSSLSSGFPLVFSADGKQLAGIVAQTDNLMQRHVKVWDAATGKELRPWPSEGGIVGNLAISPDGHYLAAAVLAGNVFDPLDSVTEVRVWDAATGKERSVLRGHNGRVELVAFSPDGSRIATTTGVAFGAGQTGNEVKIWDSESGAELLTLKGPFCIPSGMAFSSDGNRLLQVGWTTANQMDPEVVKTWDATPRVQVPPTGKE